MHSKTLVYQVLPSRYGMNPDDLRRADAIEIVIGQGAKPGGGGMLLGQKISARVAAMRDLPERHRPAQRLPAPGLDRSRRPRDQDQGAARDHRLGEADLRQGRRDARRTSTSALAVKAGADVIVLDGMQGGTAATQDVFIEHVGIPILAAIAPAVSALQELGDAPQGRADRLRRHPQRRRRGQGARARAPTRSRSASRR